MSKKFVPIFVTPDVKKIYTTEIKEKFLKHNPTLEDHEATFSRIMKETGEFYIQLRDYFIHEK